MNNTPLTVDEVADRWRVSHATVRNLAQQGVFPNAWRAGKKIIRIPEHDVENYEREQRVVNQEES